MRLRVVLWMTASAIGAALLAMPDEGERLVGFSDAHELTLLDTAAVGVLVAGWLPVAAAVWRRRDDLANSVGRSTRSGCLFIAGIGLGLVIASAFCDFGGWWAVGAGLLASVQLAALVVLAQ